MKPFDQIQSREQASTYLNELTHQAEHIEREVAAGHTVTLTLTDGTQTVSLAMNLHEVVKLDPNTIPASAQKAGSLAHNATLTALITRSYSFDLREVNQHVTPPKIEERSKIVAATTPSEIFPNPAIRQEGHDWVLAEDCTYAASDRYTITAKTGFKTDLASIPRILWPFIAFHELSVTAPVIHDLIYRAGGGAVRLPNGEVNPAQKIFTREQADRLFLELMTQSKRIPDWKCKLAYHAVDIFGRWSWRP